MKHPCSCGKVFADQELLKLHKEARHSKQPEEQDWHAARAKYRVKSGESVGWRRKSSEQWLRTLGGGSAESLASHYRPKE